MVGDRYSDVELARNAGVKSMFVMSGYGRGEWEHQRASWTEQPDLVAEDLLAAVRHIVSELWSAPTRHKNNGAFFECPSPLWPLRAVANTVAWSYQRTTASCGVPALAASVGAVSPKAQAATGRRTPKRRTIFDR